LRQEIFTVKTNRLIAKDLFRMELEGNTDGVEAMGDFVNICVPGTYLRRPISVFNVQKQWLVVVYKVVGTGTAIMSELKEGSRLDILTGLGTGYNIALAGENPLVVAGGYGAASIYGLSRALACAGKNPEILLGFNNADDVFLAKEFQELSLSGALVRVVTADGSLGEKGLVTDFVSKDNIAPHSFIYACGPIPMLKALSEKTDIQGQFSLESRMGCGFGACMGCSVMTKNGAKRICKEGPVLDKEEIIWTQV
jgi:dihydroorotate dehydrogenase electron transfer subunit